jgi:hypothetical protein
MAQDQTRYVPSSQSQDQANKQCAHLTSMSMNSYPANPQSRMGTPKIRKVTIVTDIEIDTGIGKPGLIKRHVRVDHHEWTGRMYTLDPFILVFCSAARRLSLWPLGCLAAWYYYSILPFQISPLHALPPLPELEHCPAALRIFVYESPFL